MKNTTSKTGIRRVTITSREQGQTLRDYVVRYGRPGQLAELERFISGSKPNEALPLRLPMPTSEASQWLRGFLGEQPRVKRLASGEAADLSLPIEELDLTVGAYNRLKREGINTIGALCQRTEDSLLSLRNFKLQWIEEIRMKLVGLGFALKKAD